MNSTKVVRYGCRAPIEGATVVAEQMRAAHIYRNRLIEIECARRARLRDLDAAVDPGLHRAVVAAGATVDGLIVEIRRERQRTRKRSEAADLRDRLRAARQTLRDAIKAWRERVRETRAAQADERARLHEQFLADRRKARASCGVYWGTYQLAEDAAAQAGQMPLWDRDQPQDPRFARWTGEGAVSVQIVGGLTVAELEDGSSQQVCLSDPEFPTRDRRDPNSRRSQLRKRLQLWLRVGSQGRAPVWAKFPLLLHRPLPPNCRIQRVTVRVRHIGPRPEWCAEFVVRCRPEVGGGSGAVAVDVGWRQRGDTLRVGVTCDEQGVTEELRIPERIVSGLQKPNELRRVRDQNFDAARDKLGSWLRKRDRNCPVWLREATETLPQWKSQARLAALAIRWRATRFDGDESAFAALEAWRRQDKHLWLWETSQRTGALRARKDWFRVQAARLAERYRVLVLEKFNLRTVARHAPLESEAENETARTNRVRAAVSEFRLCLENAFRWRSGEVVLVPAENTTRECSVCGVVEAFDAAAMLRNVCPNGHDWDQDENAARNLNQTVARWATCRDRSNRRRQRWFALGEGARETAREGGQDGPLAERIGTVDGIGGAVMASSRGSAVPSLPRRIALVTLLRHRTPSSRGSAVPSLPRRRALPSARRSAPASRGSAVPSLPRPFSVSRASPRLKAPAEGARSLRYRDRIDSAFVDGVGMPSRGSAVPSLPRPRGTGPRAHRPAEGARSLRYRDRDRFLQMRWHDDHFAASRASAAACSLRMQPVTIGDALAPDTR